MPEKERIDEIHELLCYLAMMKVIEFSILLNEKISAYIINDHDLQQIDIKYNRIIDRVAEICRKYLSD